MTLFARLTTISACLFAFTALAADLNLSGREIMERYLAGQKVDSELAFISMTISRPGLSKKESRFVIAYRQEPDGAQKGLIRLVRPKDVEGVSLLAHYGSEGKVETQVFLPTLGQCMRLTGSALDKPFLGSDYSYRDLLAEVPQAHHYERLPDMALRGIDCYQVRAFESDERKDRAYAYRELLIDREKFQLVRVTFHAAGGKLIKTFMPYDYGSPQVKGATTRPHRAMMVKAGADEWTEFIVLESRLNKDIPAEVFTTRRIESWKPEEVNEFIFQFGITIVGKSTE